MHHVYLLTVCVLLMPFHVKRFESAVSARQDVAKWIFTEKRTCIITTKKKKRNNKIANDKIKHAYERLKRMKITYINGMVIWLRWRWRRCRATTIQQKKSWNLNKQMSKSRDSWHNYCTMHWVNNCPPSCIICSHAFYNCIQLLRYVS